MQAMMCDRCNLQKTKIPARGLKRACAATGAGLGAGRLQKTKIPARGLKLDLSFANGYNRNNNLQKTKIPARGLKLVVLHPHVPLSPYLQKTKIPARGLKLVLPYATPMPAHCAASKNQNPREGIETP